MPQLGESISEGAVVRWLKQVGDPVERDEPLCEISTDKVVDAVPQHPLLNRSLDGDNIVYERDVHLGIAVALDDGLGSIKRGEILATTGGNGRTVQCGLCHGADLRGIGRVPGLVGRSPTYLVRQLYDFQAGVRNGPWAALMKQAVANLTEADMVALAAYAASRAVN